MGVHPNVEGLGVGDKWRNEWRERFTIRDVLPWRRWGLDGNGSGAARGVGGSGSIIGSRYGKDNGYTL